MKRFRLSRLLGSGLLAVALVLPGVASGQAKPLGTQPAALTAEQRQATIAYLRGLQQADGGFLFTAPLAKVPGVPTGPSNVRATSSALRALRYFGGEPRDRAACRKFVQACYDAATGGFAPTPGLAPDVGTTVLGVLALVELQVPTAPYTDGVLDYLSKKAKGFEDLRMAAAGVDALGKLPPDVKRWRDDLASLRNPDGTYGSADGAARFTGGAVAAWLRLGGSLEHEQAILTVLNAGQRADGGFGKEGTTTSDLETTYRVVRTYTMLKAEPPDPGKLRGFLAACRNPDGGYGVSPGERSQVSSTYFAAILRHWLAE